MLRNRKPQSATIDIEAIERTFMWYSLYSNKCLALLSAECLNVRLIQALYHTYLKPGEVKLW